MYVQRQMSMEEAQKRHRQHQASEVVSWVLGGENITTAANLAGVNTKTARKYVQSAHEQGVISDAHAALLGLLGPEEQEAERARVLTEMHGQGVSSAIIGYRVFLSSATVRKRLAALGLLD